MKRNAFVFILSALIVCSFGLANAQDVLDVTGNPTGIWIDGTTPTVNVDTDVTWTVHMTNTTDIITGHMNGFRVFISSTGDASGELPGGTFAPMTATLLFDFTDPGLGEYDDGGFFFTYFCTGTGSDTVGAGGFAMFNGIPTAFDEDVYTFTTQVGIAEEGNFLCIDSAWYPPGGAWMWSLKTAGSVAPSWAGPYCFPIKKQPNIPASFDNCPTSILDTTHTATLTFDLDATDPDPDKCPPNDGMVFYTVVNGTPGDVNTAGVYSLAGSIALVNQGLIDVSVEVVDQCGDGDTCDFQVRFTNIAPTIDCGDPINEGTNKTATRTFVGSDADGDDLTYSVALASATMPAGGAGSFGIHPDDGIFEFDTETADGDSTYIFTVCVTDGADMDCCSLVVNVLSATPFEIQIAKTHKTYQGQHEMVDVTVNKGTEEMMGFDFLIAYDASALAFQTAIEGRIYNQDTATVDPGCGWEYFTYRYNYNGNCGNGCPSGLLRVVGMAETNNGPNHPDCYSLLGEFDMPYTLFSLDFLVTDDRTFECQYVPIRFYWMDCGDNTIAYHELIDPNPYGVQTAISRYVFDFDQDWDVYDGEITNPTFGWPTYFGAQDDPCLEGGGDDKPVPERFIDFINGGIDIACADSIDDRGDLNLNGIAYEIADAVLYTNYFVYGLQVFGDATQEAFQAAVAASDVNADGIALSVGDLVYLIRVIVGDALAYPKLAPIDASVTFASAISVDSKMGAAFVVIEGNAAPELLADNMELKYAYDAEANVTRALVYSMEANQTFEGEFMNSNGNVVSIELATYEGAPVKVNMVPSNFSLNQNFPNPFNPTTVVSFDVPKAVDYTLSVYNITGQEVAVYTGTAQPGNVELVIDGAGWSSGIYFYKLNAGDFSDTKKMVMVK